MLLYIPAVLLAHLAVLTAAQNTGLTISTQQGDVIGSLVTSGVRRFLGVPYAAAKRWEAPTLPPTRTSALNATAFGDSCPQSLSDSRFEFLKLSGAGVDNVPESDNCLSANVWAPAISRKQGTAVLLWIYGGSFSFGTSNFRVYNGENIVRDNDDITVVTINYRTNLFGQPNAPQLISTTSSQNFGLLDIEAAVKWVHDNIAAFGGDPNRITLFGESAGSVAIDAYTFTHPQDTIVKGIIQQSGTSDLVLSVPIAKISVDEPDTEAWSKLADQVGCGSDPTAAQLACMKAVSTAKLEQGAKDADVSFSVIVDDITILSDTRKRASTGNFLKVPLLGGSNANEGDIFSVATQLLELGFTIPGVTQTLADLVTKVAFTCSARENAEDRSKNGVNTWRYLYSGVFPNISTRKDLRAYHSSEIPIIFGTYNESTIAPPTSNEITLSKYMQSAWVAFAKDPLNGLSVSPFNWPKWSSSGDGKNSLVMLGSNQKLDGAVFVDPKANDGPDDGCETVDLLVDAYNAIGIVIGGF